MQGKEEVDDRTGLRNFNCFVNYKYWYQYGVNIQVEIISAVDPRKFSDAPSVPALKKFCPTRPMHATIRPRRIQCSDTDPILVRRYRRSERKSQQKDNWLHILGARMVLDLKTPVDSFTAPILMKAGEAPYLVAPELAGRWGNKAKVYI